MKQTVRVFFNNVLLSHEKCWVIGGTDGTKYITFGFYISFIHGRLQMDATDGVVPDALAGFVDFYSIRETIPSNKAIFGSYKKGAAEATIKNIGYSDKAEVKVEGTDRQEVLDLFNDIMDGKAVPVEVGKSFGEVMTELKDTKRELELARTDIRNHEAARIKLYRTLNDVQAAYDSTKTALGIYEQIMTLPWYLFLAWAIGLYRPASASEAINPTEEA